jgi:type II secretory pathway pseudopilin PulG
MFSSPQNGQHRRPAGSADSEAGYILVAVLFLVALILITLAVAAPRIAQSIQRDRELELVHRGEQYKRAVKLYYKKFQAYPSSIDQLVNTNNIKFLRKRYTDPMTGKDDWKIIHQGEEHLKVMGLFGQPIASSGGPSAAGTSIAGMGAGGFANGAAAAPGTSALSSGVTGTSGSTTGSSDGSGGSTQNGSAFGQSGAGGTTGTSGLGSSGPGSSGFGGGAGGNTNPTFGGGPIVGVKVPNTKASIKEYKQQKHYNEWEFVYLPLEDQMQGGGAMFGGAGANLNGVGNGTTNPTSPTSGFGGTGFGNSGAGIGGTNPTPMPTPSPTPTPQQ